VKRDGLVSTLRTDSVVLKQTICPGLCPLCLRRLGEDRKVFSVMEEEGGGVSSAATGNVNDGPADAVVQHVELMEIVDAKPSGGEEGQDITTTIAAVEDTIIDVPQHQQQQEDEVVVVKKVKKTKFKKSLNTAIEGGVKPIATGFATTRKIKKVSPPILFPHSCTVQHNNILTTLFIYALGL